MCTLLQNKESGQKPVNWWMFLAVYLIFAILSFNQNKILADRPLY
jgi:hypothetical protein